MPADYYAIDSNFLTILEHRCLNDQFMSAIYKESLSRMFASTRSRPLTFDQLKDLGVA